MAAASNVRVADMGCLTRRSNVGAAGRTEEGESWRAHLVASPAKEKSTAARSDRNDGI